MSEKEKVIVDPHGRRMEEIFHPDDLRRLQKMADVVWARDEPMPAAEAVAALPEAAAVVTSGRS